MGNLIGVSRTPPHLSDLLKVHENFKQPVSPKQQQQQQQQQLNNNATPMVELFSSYLFMWRVYVDHKNQLMIQYDPVDLFQFKKFNSNDCYIVLHVINNSELYKQFKQLQDTTITSSRISTSSSSSNSAATANVIHYYHQQHQLLHHFHHLNNNNSNTNNLNNNIPSSSDDVTLKSFMTSAQSELTPRGLSCPAGVFSFDPISHIETEEITHDVYIWNGKNSDPLTKAFCIAKGFDFVKALKYSDSLSKQRTTNSNNINLETINNSIDSNGDKNYWKLPNTSLIIQRLFQTTTSISSSTTISIPIVISPISPRSSLQTKTTTTTTKESISPRGSSCGDTFLNSNFGPLSNYFIDDLSPLLDKSINGPGNQQQQYLYNNFHIFKRIIKKNFPHLLNLPTLPTPISESFPISQTIFNHHQQQDQQEPIQQDNNNNNNTNSLTDNFQKFLDFTTTTTTTTTTSSCTPNKDNLEDSSFPSIPKFNPRYEVLRKLSSNRVPVSINNVNNVISSNNETIPITVNNINNNSNNSNNSIITTNTNNNGSNNSGGLTSPTSINTTTIKTTTTSKSIPFIPKLPINKIKIIPVLDIPIISDLPQISPNCEPIVNNNNNNNNNNSNNVQQQLQKPQQELSPQLVHKPQAKKAVVPLLNLFKQNSCSSIQIPQCLNQSNISSAVKQQIKIPTLPINNNNNDIPQTPRGSSQQLQETLLTLDQILQMSQREQINYFEPILNQITERVYLGSRIPASNLKLLKDQGISHIINCAGMVCTNHFPNDFVYKTLYISDGPGEDIWCLFYEVMDFIEDAVEKGGKVYIHCHQGISRSSAFVILYLMWKNDWDFKRAHEYTKEIRYISNPNPGFTGQLLHWKKFIRSIHNNNGSAVIGKDLKLFRMVQLLGNIIVPKAVSNISYLSLDSRCCFILIVPQCIYLWLGEHCLGSSGEAFVESARKAITRFQKYENSSSNIVEIKQGQEDQDFWNLLTSSSSSSSTTLTATDSSTTTTTTTTINFINYTST